MKYFVVYLLFLPLLSNAQQQWTLESTVNHAVKVSPLMSVANAGIQSAEGSANQAGRWPNPVVEVTATDKLGINEAIGGNDLTQTAITQTIPLWKKSAEKSVAESDLRSAHADRDYQQLVLENDAAKTFHKVQLTDALFKLAQERLGFARRSQEGRSLGDPLVRYLSPLEKKRLIIVGELAEQELASAEGELGEARSGYKTLMQLPLDQEIEIEKIKEATAKFNITVLQQKLSQHSAVETLKFKHKASEHSVDLAKGGRVPDLTLTYFRELDFLDNRRQHFNGFTVGITLPLWNFNSGEVAKARAESLKAQNQQTAMQYELLGKLHQTFVHFGHLTEQAEKYRTKILGPAEEVFNLTTKSFKAGEVNVLSLIDASNTYFDARKRYVELLYESWVELADLRLAAGISILDAKKTEGTL